MSTISSRPVHHVFLILGIVVLAQFQREEDIFGHRQGIEQGAGLEDHGHFLADPAQLAFGKVGDIFVGHNHAAARRASGNP